MWKTSGHYDFYHENMYFFEIDEGDGRVNEYAVKPMNCPGHVMIFGNEVRSYRDLPMRIFEFGTVYRHEMSGVVHGLMRARGFTQDDAHIFCAPEQVHGEVVKMLELVDFVMGGVFGFEYSAEISTRPEKSIGEDAMWELATESLKGACATRGLAYEINEGDGAFYGPKIDIKLKDAIGRTWQCSTIQVDFNFPERFDLTYRTGDNTEARPFMLHRTILGSMERFLGILIEHYAGAFPTLARTGAGGRHPDLGPPHRLRRVGPGQARGTPACASRSTRRTSRCASRSPRRSSRRSRTCSSSATRRPSPARSASASAPAGDIGSKPIDEFVALVKDGDPLA